ncbi:uncharacterized protein PAE49_010259 [Odontesthes bonariensis]|uniref:uncharacterized protein LOC142388895 n=1 Tax=Odontesthes bonariensis TaxID=219752 RepID=UPI003F58D512
MKLILTLTLIWALCSTAGALVCQACANLQCSLTVPKTCKSETMCITAAITATSSGSTAQQIFKDCAPSSQCPITGNQAFSVSLGFATGLASAQCCNTDGCNSQTLPFPSPQPANSLQCAVCDPSTSQCSAAIQCSGQENNCFSATVTSGSTTYPALGCVTQNTCAAASSLGTLPFMTNVGTISSGPTCCTTSLCNSPVTTTTTAPTTTTTAPTTTTTTTTAPTTTTTAPTTTTTTAPTTTTTTAPTTTTTAPTTTTTAPTTTTTAPTTAPTTTTTAPTTTTTAPTTTTTAPTTTTTTAPTTTTTAPTTTTTTTTSDGCSIRLSLLHLLLGLFIFAF